MKPFNLFQRLSKAPTNPEPVPEPANRASGIFLDRNNAIISPHYDIEYNDNLLINSYLNNSPYARVCGKAQSA